MPSSLRRLPLLLMLIFIGAILTVATAVAQIPGSTAAPQAPPTADASSAAATKQIEELVATLETEERRKEMVERLKLMLAAQKQVSSDPPSVASFGSRMLGLLSERVAAASEDISAFSDAFAGLPVAIRSIHGQLLDPVRREYLARLSLGVGITLVVGFTALWAMARILRRPRNLLGQRAPEGKISLLALLVARTALDLIPVVAFGIAAYGLLSFVDPPRVPRLVALTVVNASILVQLVRIAARMLLAPNSPQVRLLPFSDETAHYAFIWIARLAIVAIYGFFIASAARLLGLSLSAQEALLKLVGLIVASMLVILVLQNRRPIASWIRREHEVGSGEHLTFSARFRGLKIARNRLADVWHILAILYIAAAFVIWALEIRGGFDFMLRGSGLSVVILAVAAIVLSGARKVIHRGFSVSPALKERFPDLDARVNRYVPILYKILSIAIWSVAVLAVLAAWGVDSFAWLETPMGRVVLGRIAAILFVLLAAVIIWELISSSIERYLANRNGKAQRSARIRTLLPLARNAAAILLTTLVSLIVLSEMGVDTAPLLAGAGVVGLAIGFGAQTLVKDVITGLFILIEDTIAIGDIITVAGKGGQVEAMSIRSIRLRDYDGSVHTVPFSEVTTVLNRTKGFSYYVFDVGVAYREDTDEVVNVLRELGAEMQADPAFGPLILEPLDIAGVDKLGDSAVIIKARFKTQPIKQWTIGREFNRRIKKRFDELGIEIPFPHQTIYFGEDKGGRAPAARLRIENPGSELDPALSQAHAEASAPA